ncbi:MAG: dihydroorotate dehydrogenase [Candidatus Thermoplasmatota archaeon]|nr:dihydroorotate dehydrogenase [Candidatus Thermoplasmatota archaeon]
MPDITASIGGIEFLNPFLLASGILDENGYTIRRILEEGAGGAVTKSIGLKERKGYRPPIVVPLETGLLNAVGLPNPGIDEFSHEMDEATRAGKPVIGSIFAATPEEFLSLGEKMEQYGASAVELNLSCPHVKGVGSEVGSDPELVSQIISLLKKKLKIPVFSKLSPNVTDILQIAEAASRSDGFVLINTVRGMAIDITAKKPILSNKIGGLSGRAIKHVGVRMVWDVFENFDVPIIGVGGIETLEDALEYIMAGASAVQIGTAVYTQGRSIFRKLENDLLAFLKREGIESLKPIIGVAHS